MRALLGFAAAIRFVRAYAQSSDYAANSATAQRTVTPTFVAPPSGSYYSYSAQSTVVTATQGTESLNGTRTEPAEITSFTPNTLLLQGSRTASSTTSSSTNSVDVSHTASSPQPINTQPCNNYVEFCNRKYMNVTEVCAHNAPFTTPNNAARNQDIVILGQLNDGIRMLSGETQHINNTIYMCHTSCDILNSGTLESHLTTIRQWIDQHPFDIVTILLVNPGHAEVSLYSTPINNSGISAYLYEPPKIPMHRDDWPTYGQMIISGKRVVIFMDYAANQTQVPYILDEFSQMWETPFSPTDINFPCDQQRPPGLSREQQDQNPYLANHNLNVELGIGSVNILIPNFADIELVNANNASTGSLSTMANSCRAQWGRPPAWLLVDFYDVGEGSVFEVAADMNNVSYNRDCCGERVGLSGAGLGRPSFSLLTVAIVGIFAILCDD